jgi:hypothetical protein
MRHPLRRHACLLPTLALLVSCGAEGAVSGTADSGSGTAGAGGNGTSAASGGRTSGNGGSNSGAGSTAIGSGGMAPAGRSTGGTDTGGRAAGDAGSSTGGTRGEPDGGGGGGAYPDTESTGPNLAACQGGVLKKYAGSSDYRPKTGEVVSCMEFDDAAIYVPAEVSNVTIENCAFVTTVDLFVNIQGSGVTIQDCEFHGPAETWIRNSYSGDHLTVRRSEFTGMGNAVEFNVGHETIEDNFAHDFGTASPTQHADGLQTDGTSHAVIRHNTVLLNDVAGATGAISIMGDSGDDVLVENNKVGGGGYTVYPGGAKYTNIRFLNNCFSDVFYPGKAQSGNFGPWYPSMNPPTLVRSGNTWCDGPKSGQALNGNP